MSSCTILRLLSLACLIACSAAAQTINSQPLPGAPVARTEQTPSLLPSGPRIGAIEVYGAHEVGKAKILKALGAKVGDPLPRSKGDTEERITGIDGILDARLEAYCCDNGKPVLYVGVLERGSPKLELRPEPTEIVTLPLEIVEAYSDFASALRRAGAEGETAEDLTAGHSFMAYLPAKVRQERFLGLAGLNFDQLKTVLLQSEDPEQRAISAYVIGYADDKQAVTKLLQQALRDPDENVRANAARSLKAIAVMAEAQPKLEIRVPSTWFVELLNSPVLSDRLEAVRALAIITEKPTEAMIANLKERALPALSEMASWQVLPHALPAFLVLGRTAGWTDANLQKSWAAGDRDKALATIRKTLKIKSD